MIRDNKNNEDMKMPERKKKRQKMCNKSEQSAETVAGFCRNDMTSLEESSSTLDAAINGC